MYTPDDPGTVLLRDLARGMHLYSIDCKLSGGVALSTGIKNNVTIIHGPRGCAFQQRIPVLRDLDARRVVCSNMDQNDTVFGGERKLAETIIQADKRYQPELITVLLTCATGLIGDDVQGVIQELKKKVQATVLWADTSGFSHRDLKDSSEKMLKDQTRSYRRPRNQKTTLIQGCGQEELFKSMVDQLMEDPEKYGGVNEKSAFYLMPTRWFGKWWRDYLREIREIFGAGEVQVDSISFNQSSVDAIRRLPCHRLNVKGHGRWISRMKTKFGTEYLPDMIEYYNAPFRDGIRDFYVDAARLLGAEDAVAQVVDKKIARMDEQLKPYKAIFKGKRLAVVRGWSHWGTPYLVLSQIFNLGFNLVYLDLEYDHIYDWNIDKKVIADHIDAVKGVFASYGVSADIRVEANVEEEIEALKHYQPDLVITGFDRKWIPHHLGIPTYVPYTFSFYRGITGALMAAEEIRQEFCRKIPTRPRPIYATAQAMHRYDQRRYPIPCDLMPPIKAWEDIRHVKQ